MPLVPPPRRPRENDESSERPAPQSDIQASRLPSAPTSTGLPLSPGKRATAASAPIPETTPIPEAVKPTPEPEVHEEVSAHVPEPEAEFDPSYFDEDDAEEFSAHVRVKRDDTPVVLENPQRIGGVFSEPEGSNNGPLMVDVDVALADYPVRIRNAARLLQEKIGDDTSSEVIINGPAFVSVKTGGVRCHVPNIDFEDADTYHDVLNAVVLPFVDTSERITGNEALIEGQLSMPDMRDPFNSPNTVARVHIICPPVVPVAKVTIAKKSRHQLSLEDIIKTGAMTPQMGEFMRSVARGRATIVYSGLSGSGKTTFLEAMSHHFEPGDHLVVVEDTRELRLPQSDVAYLCSQSTKPGHSEIVPVTLEWLVQQTNRMRPDRIIVGEVRGGEMAEFLVAANSGADGSMTTVHASGPQQTIAKMVSLSMKNPTAKNEESVLRDIASSVQLIVQIALIDGRHVVTEIEEVTDTVLPRTSSIATSTIFKYDRSSRRHVVANQPTENFKDFLANRGVRLNQSLFARN